MSEGIPYADILILALVAGFILLRLRSVLGQKMGNDDPDLFRTRASQAKLAETIVQLADKSPKSKTEEADIYVQSVKDTGVAEGLKAIKARDPEFLSSHFLQGAKMAFEMVFDGFAKGEKTPLKMLLSDELYEHFSSEIDARAGADSHSETTLVSVAAKDVTRAVLDRNLARIGVKFVSEQVTVVRDKDGVIIEGDASDVSTVEDEWIFERDLASKNPNWKIIET